MNLWQRRPHRLQISTLLFAFALIARLLVLFRASDSAEFLPDHGDMKFYDAWARRIAAGVWTDHHAFYGLPLYAYLLAGIYSIFGVQPYLAILLQCAVDALTAVVIYRLGSLVFIRNEGADVPSRAGRPNGAALAAALGWVFFVPAQTFSTVLMPTVYLVAAFWLVVWWVVRFRTAERPSRSLRSWAFVGVLIGVTAMLGANILFLLPLVLGALALTPRWRPDAVWSAGWRVKAAGCVLAGVFTGAAPCWMHNYFIAGEPVFLSAHGGINLWIGNHPEANGYPHIPSGLHADQQGLLDDSINVAERAAGRPLRRAEVSAYWSAQAKNFIREHPAAWLRLLAVKARNFWSALSYDDLSAIAARREEGVTLPGPGFGLIAALALPGAAVLIGSARRRRTAGWILAAVLLHLASLLTAFITERYRLAAVPGLLLLAMGGGWEALRAARARRVGFCVGYAAALALAATFVFWPSSDSRLLTHDDFNTGLAALEANQLERAQAKLERVRALLPENAEVNFALGNLYLTRGERDRAKGFYRRTLQLDPHHGRVLNNLGILALQEGRWSLAEQFLLNALAEHPADAKTNFLLAQARQGSGDLAGARASVAEAVRLQPGREDFETLRAQLERTP